MRRRIHPPSIIAQSLVACALLSVVTWVADARADSATSSPSRVAEANEHFRRGKALHQEGKHEQARDAYASAWALQPSADVAANLGSVELALGNHRAAAQYLSYALEHLLPSTTPEQKKALQQRLTAAAAKVTRVRLEIEPAGSRLSVDDEFVGETPLRTALFIEPGERKLRLERVGYAPAERWIMGRSGGEVTVAVRLEPTAAPAAAPNPPGGRGAPASSDPPSDGGTPGEVVPHSSARVWVIAGGSTLTLVGLGVGIGYSLRAGGAQDDVDRLKPAATEQCPTPTSAPVCRELTSAIDRRDASRSVALGSFIGAGVSALGTVAAVLLWPTPEGTSEAGRRRLGVTADFRAPSVSGHSTSQSTRGFSIGVHGAF